MPESNANVKPPKPMTISEAIEVLRIIKGYFPNDSDDPVMRSENQRFGDALTMAMTALDLLEPR